MAEAVKKVKEVCKNLSHRFYNAALYGFDTANVNAFFQNAMFSAIFFTIYYLGRICK